MGEGLTPRQAGAAGAVALAGLAAGVAIGVGLSQSSDRRRDTAQLDGTPRRRFYRGRNLDRAISVEDLRAITHQRLPRFALEYLEGGAEEEATLARERSAYGDWRFTPRTLVDVSHRGLKTEIFGQPAPLPLIVAPTGLNGVYRRHADIMLAQGAMRAGIPFCQSTMSNDSMSDVARSAPGLRHWWQLYVFGGDEVWQELVRRADANGCEALILTTNAQIFGNREWQRRNQASQDRLSVSSAVDAALHPDWFVKTLLPTGMPRFPDALDFIPKSHHGLFQSSDWIRDHQPKSLSWDTVAKIRQRWTRPFILKGILNLEDVRRAVDAGVDGIVISTHGGRQLDWAVAPLDLLPKAREIVGDRVLLFLSGGLRRGTDLLKALCLGADAVLAGRSILYGLCAAGAPGVEHAVKILRKEAEDAMGLLGASSVTELAPDFLLPDPGRRLTQSHAAASLSAREASRRVLQ